MKAIRSELVTPPVTVAVPGVGPVTAATERSTPMSTLIFDALLPYVGQKNATELAQLLAVGP
ncbi:hypothetical protein GCM10023094_46710 [Rhodococcus olei]|uniref:Uncharacterized protein n=1 Tax=Rhodococcus olei TaxID=2161675 RepID=A0ABP8PHE9_9NOCA